MADANVGGADGKPDGAAAAAAAGAGNGAGTDADKPVAYRPDGLPDNFYGANDKETIEKMWPALKGFMKDKSERGSVPQKFDEYNFTLSDKAQPYVQMDSDDKLLPKVKQLAQKWGMPDKMYTGFMGDFFDAVVDLGLIEKPLDVNALYLDLGKGKGGTNENMVREGSQRLNAAQAFINNLTGQQGFDKGMKDELALMTVSENGVKIIEWLMKGTVNKGVSTGGASSGGAPSKEEIAQRNSDPRNDRNHAKYDPAFAAETIELYKKFYGQT